MALPLTSRSSVTLALLFLLHQPQVLHLRNVGITSYFQYCFGVVRVVVLFVVSFHPSLKEQPCLWQETILYFRNCNSPIKLSAENLLTLITVFFWSFSSKLIKEKYGKAVKKQRKETFIICMFSLKDPNKWYCKNLYCQISLCNSWWVSNPSYEQSARFWRWFYGSLQSWLKSLTHDTGFSEKVQNHL